ncbi:hypothetical protein B4153_5734 [Bacillus cereus]|nr:hypothetical protein B4153_5734 [Bacillus cereus]KZD73167.1 hypothetical protein B4120_4662 [Bacillus cereus]
MTIPYQNKHNRVTKYNELFPNVTIENINLSHTLHLEKHLL